MLTGRMLWARRKAVCRGRIAFLESVMCPPPWIMSAKYEGQESAGVQEWKIRE